MPEILKLALSAEDFAATVAEEISTPGVAPLAAAARYFTRRLTESLSDHMGPRLIKPPASEPGNWPGRYETLRALAATGAEAGYPEFRFATRSADALDEIAAQASGFSLEPFDYAWGAKRFHDLGLRNLKTQTNHRLRLNHAKFPAVLFEETSRRVRAGAMSSQPYIANPEPHGSVHRHDTSLKGFRVVAFEQTTDGDRLFCGCARTAHDRMRSRASDIVGQFFPDSWPHRVVRLLEAAVYGEGLCHLCVAGDAGPGAARPYGTATTSKISRISTSTSSPLEKTWTSGPPGRRCSDGSVSAAGKSEATLFQIVKEIALDAVVQREASPRWHGRQRLDIFLPAFGLAIEYQGAQHFGPVSLFGGEEGFARARERDELKRRLCEENGVTVVYVSHGEPLTLPYIRRRLQKHMRRF
jgi:hypothetical protein